MNKVISVITAAHEPAAKYLPDAYESLRAQELPDDWQWEWIVQEDGRTGAVAAALPSSDRRISVEAGRQWGQGVARTYGLARSTGSLIKVLDADDQLTRGALDRDISTLTANPSVGWTTCRVLDLLPDGSTEGFTLGDPEPGRLTGAFVVGFWREHNYRAPVHPATFCMRRQLIVALGGWMALPAGEDTGVLISAAAISPGYFIGEPGLLYRKWPGSVTAQPEHTEPAEFATRNAMIDQRATDLMAMRFNHYSWATR